MKIENAMSTTQKFIKVIESGDILAVASISTNGSVTATNGKVYEYDTMSLGEFAGVWEFFAVDLDGIHIELDGDQMTLAAFVTANSNGDPLNAELVQNITQLSVGEFLNQSPDEEIIRIAPPREVYFVARKRDGHHTYDMKGFVWHSKEDAISDLYTKWQMWMDDEFVHNVPGEVLEDGDDESPAVVAGGELGYYRSGNNSVGEGRADFPEADYPNDPEKWIERGIESFRDDVWTWSVYTEMSYR